MSIFTNFFRSSQQHGHETADELKKHAIIRHELAATKNMFGPLKEGVKRDFFCLDDVTWIWYEEWLDEQGERHYMTTRYKVGDDGIMKSQNGGPLTRLSSQELETFESAASTYVQKLSRSLYKTA